MRYLSVMTLVIATAGTCASADVVGAIDRWPDLYGPIGRLPPSNAIADIAWYRDQLEASARLSERTAELEPEPMDLGPVDLGLESDAIPAGRSAAALVFDADGFATAYYRLEAGAIEARLYREYVRSAGAVFDDTADSQARLFTALMQAGGPADMIEDTGTYRDGHIIPEPSAGLLLIAGGFALLRRRSRRV